jgi:hypothetical protein
MLNVEDWRRDVKVTVQPTNESIHRTVYFCTQSAKLRDMK